MSKEITLPSGHTVKLRDFSALLKKDRDKVAEIASHAETELMQQLALQDGLIAVCVLEWSYDLIPPSIRLASLGDLTPADADALALACAPAAEYLFPNLFPTEESKQDPKADTANSND